ncbi:MAG: triose-phosphate isomerase [Candidatus Hodarchaeales archaeon]|jgi:triosephosphate isomerase
MRRFVIGGNWKMQLNRVGDAVKIAEKIAYAINDINSIEVIISPSFNALHACGDAIKNTNLKLAGQNIHYHDQGAFTGETSILSLIDAGCKYVILGHSERRRLFGESNEIICLKIHKALEKGLKPILCIGETAKERAEGQFHIINQEQLSGCLKGVTEKQLLKIIIAYEPVWAINNKFLNPDTEIIPATPKQASEAHTLVRDWIKQNYGENIADEIPIIYGGSMNEKNCYTLLSTENIDGGLIGGASLSERTFLPIIKIAEQLTRESTELKWEGNTLKFRN